MGYMSRKIIVKISGTDVAGKKNVMKDGAVLPVLVFRRPWTFGW